MFGRRSFCRISGQLESSVLEGGKVVSSFLLSQGADLAKNAFLFVTDFLVMVFTLFFLFRDGDRYYKDFTRPSRWIPT